MFHQIHQIVCFLNPKNKDIRVFLLKNNYFEKSLICFSSKERTREAQIELDEMEAGPSGTQNVSPKRRRIQSDTGDNSSIMDDISEIENFNEQVEFNKSAIIEVAEVDEDDYNPSDQSDKMVDFQSPADLLSGNPTTSTRTSK